MIEYTEETITQKIPVKYFCDKCKKEITNFMEIQEMYFIKFQGGYDSVFGDGVEVECEICQDCLKEMIGEFCRVK